MKFLSGKTYVIRIEIDSKLLTFTIIVSDEDDVSVSGTDKYGKVVSFNKSKIVYMEEAR